MDALKDGETKEVNLLEMVRDIEDLKTKVNNLINYYTLLNTEVKMLRKKTNDIHT